MKKFLILACVAFLASCGAKNNQSNDNIDGVSTWSEVVTTVTATGLTDQQRTDLEAFLKESEQFLKEKWYDVETINEALKIKKEEYIEKILFNHQETEAVQELLETENSSPRRMDNGNGTLEKNIYNPEFSEASAQIQMEIFKLLENKIMQDSQKFSIFRLSQNNVLTKIAEMEREKYSSVKGIFDVFKDQNSTLKITLLSQNPKKVDAILPTFLTMMSGFEKAWAEEMSSAQKYEKISFVLKNLQEYSHLIYISAEKYADKLDETLTFVGGEMIKLNTFYTGMKNSDDFSRVYEELHKSVQEYKKEVNIE